MKESMMNITEALKKLAEASGEPILLVHDPKDGVAVVVRWEDDDRRMAFLGSDTSDLEGNSLALYLVVRAAKYLVREAQKAGDMRLALRLRVVENEVFAAVE